MTEKKKKIDRRKNRIIILKKKCKIGILGIHRIDESAKKKCIKTIKAQQQTHQTL